MSEKKTDRLRVRDLAAKTERFVVAYGYSTHDAELLAEAELEMEEEKRREKDGDERT
jgi:hypothetical protein